MEFRCPLLEGDVELSAEREQRIRHAHPDLLPHHLARIAETLLAPDVAAAAGTATPFFTRGYPGVPRGRFVVVVVVREPARNWIVTAYQARKITRGEST